MQRLEKIIEDYENGQLESDDFYFLIDEINSLKEQLTDAMIGSIVDYNEADVAQLV